MSSNTQKLRVLRARTNYDLVILVQRELDRGLSLVKVASTRNSPLFAQADRAYQTATALLPRIGGLSHDDRLRIEGKVKELRSRLDQVTISATYPVSLAS